ncbi:hypothetical protein FH972_004295 [Carpinus fangiana]|uniref:Uncharacterized protein n=1 Tax=Carpinus fangiana TaxID=176857 RepID=A0A5N6QN58_9ROSI|nr:hypothetical protein FH972_004295 [Carpinus fangiana]
MATRSRARTVELPSEAPPFGEKPPSERPRRKRLKRWEEELKEKEGHLKYLSTPKVVVPNFEDVDEQNFGPFLINRPSCQKFQALASIVSAPEQEKDQIRNFCSEGYSDENNGHRFDGSWNSMTNLRARRQEFVPTSKREGVGIDELLYPMCNGSFFFSYFLQSREVRTSRCQQHS